MSFKQYRIIFILIFMLASGGTYLITAAEEQQSMTNEMENAQSGELFTFPLYPYNFTCTSVKKLFESMETVSDFCHDFYSHFAVILFLCQIDCGFYSSRLSKVPTLKMKKPEMRIFMRRLISLTTPDFFFSSTISLILFQPQVHFLLCLLTSELLNVGSVLS